MTNGEKLKEVFPSIELYEKSHDAIQIDFNSVWWNAEYKEPTTKNDLDDCISRFSAKQVVRNHYCGISSKVYNKLMVELDNLSSVTPIRPKGHWIKIGDRGFGYSDTVICKCSECEYKTEFTGKFDGYNLVIDMENADNYCPNCGAKMDESEG